MITKFAAGKRRYICVNRKAIATNIRKKTNYPTMILVDNGVFKEFHEIQYSNGRVKFDGNRHDLPAKVFIETDDEVIALQNENAEPTFLNRNKESLLNRSKAGLLAIAKNTPVISCFFE